MKQQNQKKNHLFIYFRNFILFSKQDQKKNNLAMNEVVF